MSAPFRLYLTPKGQKVIFSEEKMWWNEGDQEMDAPPTTWELLREFADEEELKEFILKEREQ